MSDTKITKRQLRAAVEDLTERLNEVIDSNKPEPVFKVGDKVALPGGYGTIVALYWPDLRRRQWFYEVAADLDGKRFVGAWPESGLPFRVDEAGKVVPR